MVEKASGGVEYQKSTQALVAACVQHAAAFNSVRREAMDSKCLCPNF